MKITRIKTSPLNLIPRVALTVAYGSYPELAYALVEINTDQGLTGLGEAAPDPMVTGETQESTLAVLAQITEYLVDKDPMQIRTHISVLAKEFPHAPAALAAIDMALFDLVGKQVQQPVFQLLGGAGRYTAPLYPVIPMDTPETMAEMAAAFSGLGGSSMKIKLGSDPAEDRMRVEAITQAIGTEIRLRPDINQGWGDPDTALSAIKSLSPYPIDWIEQPVVAGDLEGLAKVCCGTEIPIMADESCHSPQDALRIIQMKAADILNIKLMKCGGLLAAQEILAIAKAADIPCILGSMGESGIGSAAGMHLMAAYPEILGCELIGPLFLEGDPSVGYQTDLDQGMILVPRSPGLGVQLRQ
jgi:L-alanine-DL-glutamate epimerase-like enolase superfamily enzyme